jgi:hypothetical protein
VKRFGFCTSPEMSAGNCIQGDCTAGYVNCSPNSADGGDLYIDLLAKGLVCQVPGSAGQYRRAGFDCPSGKSMSGFDIEVDSRPGPGQPYVNYSAYIQRKVCV